ncbi:GNAT family N-acetyltransferase [Streptomyces sp. GZWMJZ-114]|uniref:GNAT family N-acetyltransferase n=1 Tax=Streptomyces sp. GZWMJZ-114 TaxID=2494734 RepID=UPI001010B935|nr:GNAT family N-acetyltransferase [Streptomyces sp. GZWMJZ-114]
MVDQSSGGDVLTRTNNCLFEEAWWLDTTAPAQWGEAVTRAGDEVTGRWCYVQEELAGLSVVCMPHLTQTAGPWVRSGQRRPARELSEQIQIVTELLDLLPPHDLFVQNLHHSQWNLLPLHWKGFRSAARLTYVLNSLDDPDLLWANMLGTVRTRIRKAERHFTVRHDGGAEDFLPLHRSTFGRQGMNVPWPLATVRNVCTAATKRGQGRVLLAVAPSGRAHAGIVVVWDERTMYYLLSGSDEYARQHGAVALLIWEAIQLAAEVSSSFDFEGSMLPGVERMFRGFGARQVPYLQVWRSNGKVDALSVTGELPADTFLRLRADAVQRGVTIADPVT